jgi:UDP-N-acetylmuramoyl-tripeptide--D-alanyl-D-alanine ligase
MMAFATAPLLTLPEVARMAQGDLVARDVPGTPLEREAFLRSGVDGVSIDTRTLTPGQLFVPLRGGQTDGHRFLAEAFRKGAALALCERAAYAKFEGREPGPLVVVEDATSGLQRLAAQYREGWQGLMIGVTGSSGKTTTKDLVAAVLASAAPTLKTEGNLNNHWGVPMTLLRLRPGHRAAVVEIAMNHPGEIALLAALAVPGAALITNAGSAHLEGLGSLEAIAREKASLGFALRAGEPLFAGADSPRLLAALAGVKARLVTYGFAKHAAVRPRRVEDLGAQGSRVEVAGFPPVHLHLVGWHQVANALGALAVARELGLDPAAVAGALAAYRPAKGRMEVRSAQGATLLLDYYNANPESTAAALETLEGWPDATRRIAVLGDMLELGEGAAELHRETAARIRKAELWAIGPHAADYVAGVARARVAPRVFEGLDELKRELAAALAPGVVVLLKASRGMRLERALEGVAQEP